MSKIFAALSFVAVFVDARHCLYDNRPLLESCGRGCLAGPGKASCVTRCLIGKRVRSNCAQCLGNGFSCALRSCRGQCQRGFASAGCTDCVRRSCGLCSHAGKSLEEGVNQTEISQILAEVVFSAKKEELEQAFKNDEPEPEQPKSAPESEQKLAEDKAAGCYENRRALKACGTQCFSAANRGQCARRCLRDTWGMSANCANCFGDKVDCTIRKCLPKCAGSSEAWKCTNCVRTKCGRCNMKKSGEGEEMSDNVLNAVVQLATAAGNKDSEEAFYP